MRLALTFDRFYCRHTVTPGRLFRDAARCEPPIDSCYVLYCIEGYRPSELFYKESVLTLSSLSV